MLCEGIPDAPFMNRSPPKSLRSLCLGWGTEGIGEEEQGVLLQAHVAREYSSTREAHAGVPRKQHPRVNFPVSKFLVQVDYF